METFSLQVVSPTGTALDAVVSSVRVPSSTGEIGILPGHIGYIGLLGTGVLEATGASGERHRLVVSGGFCSFADGKLTILTDAVDLPGERGAEELAQESRALEQSLQSLSMYEPEWQAKRDKLMRLQSLESLS
jgi:F-type H+-transporting ATPase subunit epsilon